MINDSDEYYKKIMTRFPYINYIWITDCEGVVIKNLYNKNTQKQFDGKILERLKNLVTFGINSTSDQLQKTQKEKLKSIVTIYDEQLLFQVKFSQSIFLHILSDSTSTNIEMLKIIANDISENVNIKELNNVFTNVENL
jgi:hypothetical protein